MKPEFGVLREDHTGTVCDIPMLYSNSFSLAPHLMYLKLERTNFIRHHLIGQVIYVSEVLEKEPVLLKRRLGCYGIKSFAIDISSHANTKDFGTIVVFQTTCSWRRIPAHIGFSWNFQEVRAIFSENTNCLYGEVLKHIETYLSWMFSRELT